MKVLYISGYSRMILFNKLIPKALREIGFDVEEFDWNSIYRFNKTLRIIPEKTLKEKINSEIIKKTKSCRPDFIFVLKGEPVYTSTLEELKLVSNAKLFNWFGDDPWEFKEFSGNISKYYDYFFTYDPFSVKLYREAGHKNAHHLPYGYDPEITENINVTNSDVKKYSCDVAFIGSHYPKREESLKQLKSRLNLKIWGRGWKNTSCSDVYQGGALYGYEMLKAMKCCKVLLNIHKGFQDGVEESGEGLNLRIMEGAACGSFQITNLQNDLPNRFVLNEEIVAFKDWNEAEALIIYYLKNEAERTGIGKKAFQRLKKDHTLKNRMKYAFDLMKN
jgi:spore maturation protein CgeB